MMENQTATTEPFTVYTTTAHNASDRTDFGQYVSAREAHRVALDESATDTNHVYFVIEQGVRGFTSYDSGKKATSTTGLHSFE